VGSQGARVWVLLVSVQFVRGVGVSVQVRVLRVVVLPDIRVAVNVGSAWFGLGLAWLSSAPGRRARKGDGEAEDGAQDRGRRGLGGGQGKEERVRKRRKKDARRNHRPGSRVRLDEFDRKSMTVAKVPQRLPKQKKMM
jgi:hypothetical protein